MDLTGENGIDDPLGIADGEGEGKRRPAHATGQGRDIDPRRAEGDDVAVVTV